MDIPEPSNPAEQVERIREILVGQDIQLINERIKQLEDSLRNSTEEVSRKVNKQLEQTEQQHKSLQDNLQIVTDHIRQQLQQESVTRGLQINDLVSKIDEAAEQLNETSQHLMNEESGPNQEICKQIENLSSEMTSRIDAHSRQIMEHMHREIQQWKHRMDEQISALSQKKADRDELSSRMARIASAAMGDPLATPPNVTASNYSGPSIPRPNLGSLTGVSPTSDTSPSPASPDLGSTGLKPSDLPDLSNPDIFPTGDSDSKI